MYTLLMVLVLFDNSVAVEDVGIYGSKERCEAVATQLQTEMKEAGADSVLVCVPTDEQTEA